ncbi:MAG: DUF2325 domain-containing protein [Betaproteobacteria bacterium]|nr:DUF2325 domain-containing protein [Betaproteobacteria bacterium]
MNIRDPLFPASLIQKPPFEAFAAQDRGSRRRKLWEISARSHCPLIGVCFEVDELRALMGKVMDFTRNTSDYVLHTSAVGACESRTPLADLLHKSLEKRFRQTVRQFAGSKDSDSVYALWRAACDTGADIPGALWAAWTHPACDAALEIRVYRDIHMIQHQVGSGARADLDALKTLKVKNAQLRLQLSVARAEADALRVEKTHELLEIGLRHDRLRAELAGKDALVAGLTAQLEVLRQSVPDLKARQTLARRASDAEARATALTAKAAELEEEAERLRRLARHADETIQQLLAVAERMGDETGGAAEHATPSLSGLRILCVGGRTGSVDAYRKEVERRGGCFLHHDGGLEESLHRIDSAMTAADLVVCQAGCISHNAYWRVKEQCKRTGKQCLFIKSAGATGFGRMVSAAYTRSEGRNPDAYPIAPPEEAHAPRR